MLSSQDSHLAAPVSIKSSGLLSEDSDSYPSPKLTLGEAQTGSELY